MTNWNKSIMKTNYYKQNYGKNSKPPSEKITKMREFILSLIKKE